MYVCNIEVVCLFLLTVFGRFLIEDMTQADLLAQDKEFEIYLREKGWDGQIGDDSDE